MLCRCSTHLPEVSLRSSEESQKKDLHRPVTLRVIKINSRLPPREWDKKIKLEKR
jgi:hypothetical protein